MGTSKLDDLADKSASKNGNTAYYLETNQALHDDIRKILEVQISPLMEQISDLNEKVSTCPKQLEESKIREKQLLAKVNILENILSKDDVGTKDDYYVVGSSILREVRSDDISDGKVSCIKGGLISDVNKNIQNLETTPKAKNTVVGGNDLEKEEATYK